MMKRLFELLSSCLAPPRCKACEAPLFAHANPYLCPKCAEEIEWLADGFRAGRDATPHLDGVVAVARYQHGVRNLVRSFKYHGETWLAKPMAGMMAARVRGADFFEDLDMIAPVALHPARRRERGFDQAEILAESVSRETGIPSRSDILKRRTRTAQQALLQRAERLQNMRGAFTADKNAASGKQILLIDDVMTTGSTLDDCARACRKAGAAKVHALVFAR